MIHYILAKAVVLLKQLSTTFFNVPHGRRKMSPVLFWSTFFPDFSDLDCIRSISPYSVRMRENPGKMWTRISPNTDSFYAVERLTLFGELKSTDEI